MHARSHVSITGLAFAWGPRCSLLSPPGLLDPTGRCAGRRHLLRRPGRSPRVVREACGLVPCRKVQRDAKAQNLARPTSTFPSALIDPFNILLSTARAWVARFASNRY